MATYSVKGRAGMDRSDGVTYIHFPARRLGDAYDQEIVLKWAEAGELEAWVKAIEAQLIDREVSDEPGDD